MLIVGSVPVWEWDNSFGQGTGRIILSHVNCWGDEERLIDCSTTDADFDTINCDINVNAAIRCEGELIPPFTQQWYYFMPFCRFSSRSQHPWYIHASVLEEQSSGLYVQDLHITDCEHHQEPDNTRHFH